MGKVNHQRRVDVVNHDFLNFILFYIHYSLVANEFIYLHFNFPNVAAGRRSYMSTLTCKLQTIIIFKLIYFIYRKKINK